LSKPLAQLFSKSLQTSTFPDIWKIASVVPVSKNGVKDLIQNYRPISLLSIIGKSMERPFKQRTTNTNFLEFVTETCMPDYIKGPSYIEKHYTDFLPVVRRDY
jgi:hypothetical protein